MKSEHPNPILKKLRRPSDINTSTGKANVFFSNAGAAKIVTVDSESILYSDSDGKIYTIYFKECFHCSDNEKEYVGKRGLLSSPPWVEFFDKQNTRFEFESKGQAVSLLFEPLAKLEIRTIDMD